MQSTLFTKFKLSFSKTETVTYYILSDVMLDHITI